MLLPGLSKSFNASLLCTYLGLHFVASPQEPLTGDFQTMFSPIVDKGVSKMSAGHWFEQENCGVEKHMALLLSKIGKA